MRPPPVVRAPLTTAQVRVGTGDSLWLLSSRRLGGGASAERIAAYWPRLYAANRQLVGDDPSLLTPGQILREPRPGADPGR